MADQDIDRMVDMHAEVIGRQLEARTQPIATALEQWRDGKPRLVMSEAMAKHRRTLKRKRQRARAKARKAAAGRQTAPSTVGSKRAMVDWNERTRRNAREGWSDANS